MSERINLTRTPYRIMDINLSSTTGIEEIGDKIACYSPSVSVYWDHTTPKGLLRRVRAYIEGTYGRQPFSSRRLTKDLRKHFLEYGGEWNEDASA